MGQRSRRDAIAERWEGQGEFWLRPLGIETNTTLMHRIGTRPSEATEKPKFFGQARPGGWFLCGFHRSDGS
jgi:hypothetical protein